MSHPKEALSELAEVRAAFDAAYEEYKHKVPTKICGPNLVGILNSAGFYKKEAWVGLTDDEITQCSYDVDGFMIEREVAMRAVEAKLREKNGG